MGSLMCACFFSGARGQGALLPGSSFGFRAGAVVSFGTHIQRLGLNLNVYYIHRSFQANSEVRWHYNLKSLGPPARYGELVLSQGILYVFGKTREVINPFVTTVSNQTGHDCSVGYSYNAYFNSIGTRQQTGTISLEFGALAFITENDILAKPALDRFRSGAFLFRYRHEDLAEAGLSCTIWTGHYRKRAEITGVPVFYNNCYMDTAGGTYTGYSHGLLIAHAKLVLPYAQFVRGSAGIDAEQVRDLIQNRLMHNMKFVPSEINKAKNCHLPMTDDKGGQYLYRKDQKIRKARPFLNFSANDNLFY